MNITKKEFEVMYYSITNKEMAKKLNMSIPTLIKYARKLDLKKREGFNSAPRLTFVD